MSSKGDCRRTHKESKITVKEKGRSATFLNLTHMEYVVSRVDGCMVTASVASDFVVSQSSLGDVIVELKGKDVDHAVDQIKATAELWTSERYRVGRMAALVVCNQYPRIDTKIQKMKKYMSDRYKAPLHIKTRNQEYDFTRLLEFKGPD